MAIFNCYVSSPEGTHNKTWHVITEDSPNDEAYQKFWCSDKNNQIQGPLRARSISYNIDWNQKHGAQLLGSTCRPNYIEKTGLFCKNPEFNVFSARVPVRNQLVTPEKSAPSDTCPALQQLRRGVLWGKTGRSGGNGRRRFTGVGDDKSDVENYPAW